MKIRDLTDQSNLQDFYFIVKIGAVWPIKSPPNGKKHQYFEAQDDTIANINRTLLRVRRLKSCSDFGRGICCGCSCWVFSVPQDGIWRG